jgi:exosortase A-associated hydrolase 2
VQAQAFFLPADAGQRFCLLYRSQGNLERGLVVFVHPFAEEMNKSRRVAAVQARALSAAGFTVLQIDLLGCGDSSGDFGDASWQSWVADVVAACRWLRVHSGKHVIASEAQQSMTEECAPPPLWLWGLRAGCLLAADAGRQLKEPCNYLFWQAPAAGKTLLHQFLRLKAAGDMLGGQSRGVMETMRQQLAGGFPVEIAGYLLAPGLALGLEQAMLSPPAALSDAQRMVWLELSTREDASLSPASAKTITLWQQAGYRVSSHIAQGPAFWQTTEIEEAPALIEASLLQIMDASPG